MSPPSSHPPQAWIVACLLAPLLIFALRQFGVDAQPGRFVVDREMDRLGQDLDRALAARRLDSSSLQPARDIATKASTNGPTEATAKRRSAPSRSASRGSESSGPSSPDPRPGGKQGSPIWVFMGDSRYADGLAEQAERKKPDALHHLKVGEMEVDALFLVGLGRDSITNYQALFDRIIELRPQAVIVQPSLLVRNPGFGSMASLGAPPGSDEFHRGFVQARWRGAENPNAEQISLVVGRQFFARLQSAGIITLVGVDPMSALVQSSAPASFFSRRRELLLSLLEDPETDYLVDQVAYPNSLFKDYRHLNSAGRERFRPALLKAVAAAVEFHGDHPQHQVSPR